jgi:hypothetical protein
MVGTTFPSVCPGCNTFIGSEAEHVSNKVKVLSRGKELFEQFNAISDSILDSKGEALSINAYDIGLKITGAERKTKIFAIAMEKNNDVISIPDDQKFDLTNPVVQLSPSEMIELQQGAQLRDLFAARRASTDAESAVLSDASAKIAEVQKSVEKLFNA